MSTTRDAYLALGGILETLDSAAYTIRITNGYIEAQGRIADGMEIAAQSLGAVLVHAEITGDTRWVEYVNTISGVEVRITAHEPAAAEEVSA